MSWNLLLHILKNGHKEYIPPAGVITYEYWNELVKNPELVDEVLASNVANISSVSCIIFVLEILYALAVYDSLRSRDGRWILLIVPIAFISYKICRQLFITYIPVYHMFMLLLPTEFVSIVLEVLIYMHIEDLVAGKCWKTVHTDNVEFHRNP